VIYEDGEQTRDFSYVEDIARANLLAANSDQLDGKAVNVGSGRAVTIKRVTELISAALRIPLAPIMNREFRPGEMRHLISDTTVIRNAGYAPAVSLEEGIERYLEWIRQRLFRRCGTHSQEKGHSPEGRCLSTLHQSWSA